MNIRHVVWGLVAGGIVLLAHTSVTLADYPGPNGNVEATVSDTTSGPGADVTVAATVLDESGNPVADASCSMTISSRPAGGSVRQNATIVQHASGTNANGLITGTLHVGAVPGNVTVKVQCPIGPGASDVLSTTVTVTVTPAVGADPTDLPSTGTGPGYIADNPVSAMATAIVALLALGAWLLMFGSLAVRGTAKR